MNDNVKTKKILLEVKLGADLRAATKEAFQVALKNMVQVEFKFNDRIYTIHPEEHLNRVIANKQGK